jgi:hypothetical protein
MDVEESLHSCRREHINIKKFCLVEELLHGIVWKALELSVIIIFYIIQRFYTTYQQFPFTQATYSFWQGLIYTNGSYRRETNGEVILKLE